MNKAKNFTTIISILILCTMMLGILTGCGSSKTDAASDVAVPDWVNGLSDEAVAAAKTIIANGKLVLGTSADYAPFEFHTEINGTDTIVGFDVSIAQFMSEQLGVELEVVDMSFDNLLISLNKGDFDIVLALCSRCTTSPCGNDIIKQYSKRPAFKTPGALLIHLYLPQGDKLQCLVKGIHSVLTCGLLVLAALFEMSHKPTFS